MTERNARDAVGALALAIAVVLLTAFGVVADRAEAAPRTGVTAIRPPYTTYAVPRGSVFITQAEAALARLTRNTKPAAPGCPGLPAVDPLPATAARAVYPTLTVYDAPESHRVVRVLRNPTDEGQILNVSVVDRAGLWVKVRMPVRPNGFTGWVKITDIAQYDAPYRIVVQLCAHRLTVFRAGKPVWTQPVAVGAPRTPTPTGEFYVDFITPMGYRGAYGPYLLSVAGFSNVLHQFGNGGIGQIGIHGTRADWSIGRSASHGCVRLHNSALLQLVRLVGPGTPVTIVQ